MRKLINVEFKDELYDEAMNIDANHHNILNRFAQSGYDEGVSDGIDNGLFLAGLILSGSVIINKIIQKVINK